MSQVGRAQAVADILGLKKETVYSLKCKGKLPDSIYLGRGLYNLTRLQNCIDQNRLFRTKAKTEPTTVAA